MSPGVLHTDPWLLWGVIDLIDPCWVSFLHAANQAGLRRTICCDNEMHHRSPPLSSGPAEMTYLGPPLSFTPSQRSKLGTCISLQLQHLLQKPKSSQVPGLLSSKQWRPQSSGHMRPHSSRPLPVLPPTPAWSAPGDGRRMPHVKGPSGNLSFVYMLPKNPACCAP